jgi:hypothetical protein
VNGVSWRMPGTPTRAIASRADHHPGASARGAAMSTSRARGGTTVPPRHMASTSASRACARSEPPAGSADHGSHLSSLIKSPWRRRGSRSSPPRTKASGASSKPTSSPYREGTSRTPIPARAEVTRGVAWNQTCPRDESTGNLGNSLRHALIAWSSAVSTSATSPCPGAPSRQRGCSRTSTPSLTTYSP